MKLSLIGAGLVVATSALTLVQAGNLMTSMYNRPAGITVGSMVTPANAATNAAAPMTDATTASLPTLLSVPDQIGGQKINKNAQEGVSCLIATSNNRDACGDMALKREIAKCVAGIGIQGGCFDFFNKSAIAAQPNSAKIQRQHETRRSGNSSHNYRRADRELRMLARNWF